LATLTGQCKNGATLSEQLGAVLCSYTQYVNSHKLLAVLSGLILGCVFAGFPQNLDRPEVPQEISTSHNLPSNFHPLYDQPTKLEGHGSTPLC